MNFIVGIYTTNIAELLLTDATLKLVDASVIHSMVFKVEFHSECLATVLALIHLPAIMHPGVYPEYLGCRELAATLNTLVGCVVNLCIHAPSAERNL